MNLRDAPLRAGDTFSVAPGRFFPEPPLTTVARYTDGTPIILDARGRWVDPPRCECRR